MPPSAHRAAGHSGPGLLSAACRRRPSRLVDVPHRHDKRREQANPVGTLRAVQHPEQADRDAAVRDRPAAHLQGLIDGSDAWTQRKRDELAGSLRDKPGLRRFLRRTKTGLLRTDRAAVAREAHLDGKWLLRTNDGTLATADLAAACKQLIAVERGWRDMKGALRLRPVYHYREDRIRAHVQLCWLALLLIRVIEVAACDTWRNIRSELDRMHLVTLATPDGQVAQRSVTTPGQQAILQAPTLTGPPLFFDFTTQAGTGP